MKSTLILDFISVPPPDEDIRIYLIGTGSNDSVYTETSKTKRLGYGQFEAISLDDILYRFAAAWNIDHSASGGGRNMLASIFTDTDSRDKVKIVIDNENWGFGDVLGSLIDNGHVAEYFENANPPEDRSFDLSFIDADCTWAYYDLTITGGTAPYTVKGASEGDKVIATTNDSIRLLRGGYNQIEIYDVNGDKIDSRNVVPSIKLIPKHFSVEIIPENGGYTANILPNIEFSNNVKPFDYSLDGVSFVGIGSFPLLEFNKNFTAHIRDTFGCVVQKQFVTVSEHELEQQQQRYFEWSNAGTLIASECTDYTINVKKNPYNTLSCSEMVTLPYRYIHEFDVSDILTQQFKSSYNFHKLTLMENGNATEIIPKLQHENLNQKEKVDAKLFRTVLEKMGVYFANGQRYVPDTTSPDPDHPVSEYDSDTLPSWAKAGQSIILESVGTKTINRVIIDPLRGYALELDDTYDADIELDIWVQANFNRQNYNLYEFELPILNIIGQARLIVEIGFNGFVDRTFATEMIARVPDEPNKLLFLWKDPENISGIVHQTGIEHRARLWGKLTHRTVSSSELSNSDTQARSLDQKAHTVADFECAVKGFGMENKLALASGMENFTINGLEYKKESWESELQGDSNIYVIKGLLRLGGNDIYVSNQELVLNPPATPLTAKPSAPIDVPSFLAIGDGGLILNGDGGFITVDV